MQAIQKAFMTFKSLETGRGAIASPPPPPPSAAAEQSKQQDEQRSRMMQALPPTAAATMRRTQNAAPVIPPSPGPDYDVTVGAFDVVVRETYSSFLS
jgi:hypothetical protein